MYGSFSSVKFQQVAVDPEDHLLECDVFCSQDIPRGDNQYLQALDGSQHLFLNFVRHLLNLLLSSQLCQKVSTIQSVPLNVTFKLVCPPLLLFCFVNLYVTYYLVESSPPDHPIHTIQRACQYMKLKLDYSCKNIIFVMFISF